MGFFFGFNWPRTLLLVLLRLVLVGYSFAINFACSSVQNKTRDRSVKIKKTCTCKIKIKVNAEAKLKRTACFNFGCCPSKPSSELTIKGTAPAQTSERRKTWSRVSCNSVHFLFQPYFFSRPSAMRHCAQFFLSRVTYSDFIKFVTGS